jgi:D-glycero-D-manno-heptose 1,7-bisphosphate phosphatase
MLDRDGTVIEERHHLVDPALVSLIPGTGAALRRMSALGFGLVIITNQSPVGRGMLTLDGLEKIHNRMSTLLAEEGVTLDGVYYCPHLPEDGCSCRKPRTGLAERAARELGFDTAEAFLVGDKRSDLEMGRTVGAVTILVKTGYGARLDETARGYADFIVEDLTAAAGIVESSLQRNPK